MDTREQLLALTDELRRRKADGTRAVTVTEDTLERLRESVRGQLAPPAAPAAGASALAPPPGVVAESAREYSQLRQPAVAKAAPVFSLAPIPTEPPVVTLPAGDKQTRWNALRELVTSHPVCREHLRPGKRAVLGVGDLAAKIFFCGEAPGAEEEVQGEPFVGPAGQLLTRMIQGMGLSRESVYIGNIMNWRPEMPTGDEQEQVGNRAPTAAEMNFCLPFLRAQLEIVQPSIIVALGKTAAEGLLGAGSFKTLGAVRSRWHEFGGIPLMVTYHPSYILRSQSNASKRQIWEDLLMVMERAELPISEKQRGYFL